MHAHLYGEVHNRGDNTPVQLEVSLAGGPPPEEGVELELRLALPWTQFLRFDARFSRESLRQNAAQLGHVADGAQKTVRFAEADDVRFLLRFDPASSRRGWVAVSGQFYGLRASAVKVQVKSLSHLRLGDYCLYAAFQSLLMPRSELSKLANLITEFLAGSECRDGQQR